MSTVRIKNTNPLGDVEIPALGVVVAAGEEFDVDDPDVVEGLLAQAGNFERVKATAASKTKGE